MNRIKSILTSLCLAVAGMSSLSAGSSPLSPDVKRILTPSPGEFPITALVVFDPQNGLKKNIFAGVEECGFNLVMQITNAEYTGKLLDYISTTDLKFIAGDFSFVIGSSSENKWKEDMRLFINKFKNNQKIAGWILYDEPMWNQLTELKQRYDVLLEADDSHFVSLNLVGELVESHTGPCKSLSEYLDSIQNKVGSFMDAWSFDCYPIWIRNGQFLVRYKDFYAALDAYANKSKETGIPMWSYCETMAFKSKHHDIPAATVPYISFEAFSALAYGAQGIVYWTYSLKSSNSIETYVSALVDMDGNKTPAWYAAQTVNRQIRALTPVFLGAHMQEVRHSGNIPLDNVRPFISDFGPIERLTNGEKGVLVSHLSNGGNDYLVIVNHDVQKKQSVRIKFRSDAAEISEIKVSSSGTLEKKSVKGIQKLTLSPGGYAIYQWK